MRASIFGHSAAFREVVFENVYPLYGQMDIKKSSDARNLAVQKDLILQLNNISKVINKVSKQDPLPIYDLLKYQTNKYTQAIKDQLQVDSEQKTIHFIKKEILPLFEHLRTRNPNFQKIINEYSKIVDRSEITVYKHRQAYDESLQLINKKLASLLDQKQEEAQKMFPHYFERFKSDGVEHNIYIGASIVENNTFNKIYLHNLRLWQLQAMCEMENSYYQMKHDLPISLDVASMILVFSSPLSVRFRMDEKRFDVDGTYNARYEVVKKRVDKSKIKGTNQRVTEKGKLAIVYSQRSDETEYLQYVKISSG